MAFFVRFIHVTSASLILGGALFVLVLFLVNRRDRGSLQAALNVSKVYEAVSWAAIGLVVMTGIGNLGYFGASLPSTASEWGQLLTWKLALVGVLLIFSAVRSSTVALADANRGTVKAGALQGMYAATALVTAVIVGVAIELAHF